MRSDSPGTPARRLQRPRTMRSTDVPAADARYRASITSGSVRPLVLSTMRPDGPRPGLGIDGGDHLGPGGQRRHDQAPEADLRPGPGQEVEHLGDVMADVGIGRQQPDVLVGLGGHRVVVAAPHVAVAAGAVALSADDQRHLAVGLDAAQTVDDLHPGLLEGPGPGDVGPLVEPGLQLDDGRHLFAGVGRLDQRADDGTVRAGPVERLLDGHDVGVRGRPFHERLDRGGEGLVGVVQRARRPRPGRRTGRLPRPAGAAPGGSTARGRGPGGPARRRSAAHPGRWARPPGTRWPPGRRPLSPACRAARSRCPRPPRDERPARTGAGAAPAPPRPAGPGRRPRRR